MLNSRQIALRYSLIPLLLIVSLSAVYAEAPRAAEYRAMAPVLARASEACGALGETPVANESEMIETGIDPAP